MGDSFRQPDTHHAVPVVEPASRLLQCAAWRQKMAKLRLGPQSLNWWSESMAIIAMIVFPVIVLAVTASKISALSD
jgi:hypothetical protein